jgi:hypothetical protein
VCERRVARRRRARESESNPKPRPQPKPSSVDVIERGVASIGVRSSGNLQGKEAALTHTNGHTGRASGAREEPGTLTQGAPVFSGSSRLGIEPKTPGWLVQDPTVTKTPGWLVQDPTVCACV